MNMYWPRSQNFGHRFHPPTGNIAYFRHFKVTFSFEHIVSASRCSYTRKCLIQNKKTYILHHKTDLDRFSLVMQCGSVETSMWRQQRHITFYVQRRNFNDVISVMIVKKDYQIYENLFKP